MADSTVELMNLFEEWAVHGANASWETDGFTMIVNSRIEFKTKLRV
jgi:hypothetical protein